MKITAKGLGPNSKYQHQLVDISLGEKPERRRTPSPAVGDGLTYVNVCWTAEWVQLNGNYDFKMELTKEDAAALFVAACEEMRFDEIIAMLTEQLNCMRMRQGR